MNRHVRAYVTANVVLGLALLVGGVVLVARSSADLDPVVVAGVIVAGLVVVRFPLVLGEGAHRQLFVVDGSVFAMAVLLLPPEQAFLALAVPALTELFSDLRPWDRRLLFVAGTAWSYAFAVWLYDLVVGGAALPVQIVAAVVCAFVSMAVYNSAVAVLLRMRGGALPSVSRLGGAILPTPGLYALSAIPGIVVSIAGREGPGVFAFALVCGGAFYLLYSQYRSIAVARHRMGRLFDYTAQVHTLDDADAVRELAVRMTGELLSATGANLEDRPPEDGELSARIVIDGRMRWLVASRHPTSMRTDSVDDDRHVIEVIARVASSALEKLRLAEQLHHDATHDALTGTMNRAAFEEAATVLARATGAGAGFSVLYGDLDGFKPVNDRWGHGLGDEVLRIVAARMSSSVRDGDLVSRIGGDEFLLLLRVDDPDDARSMVERIRTAVAAPIEVDGQTIMVDISLGVARWPADGTDLAQLLRIADARMYETKREHRSDHAAPAMDPATVAEPHRTR